jgi:predicted nucleic acid-binding protein
LNSDASIQRSLRRLKPEKHLKPLRLRERSELAFIERSHRPFPKLLLDTTVYIDELQGRFPPDAEMTIRVAELWHSNVTETELAALIGLLDPHHPRTQQAIRQVIATIERRPQHRILIPDREVWREAGILAGVLARIQGYATAERRRALNDALIFLSAAKHGCAVLTRNIVDFDLLMQLFPNGRAIYYERLNERSA